LSSGNHGPTKNGENESGNTQMISALQGIRKDRHKTHRTSAMEQPQIDLAAPYFLIPRDAQKQSNR